ncbi:MAG: selenocysteine-specific translation elongation factor [Acidobacteriota bacterium]
MKRVIAGMAGHIDHGKTALVKALTGIDADRLKEEKERGITIDIGFADLLVDGTRIGLIDVPGHERFVRNMLAGVHGIDLVILVVGADEGIMPQTREHFDICHLLEVKTGLVAITKTDLADPELREIVEADVLEFTRNSFLEGAPVISVSSRTGEGINLLTSELSRLARQVAKRDEGAVARLPVDRVFSIKGFGTVVTGTLIAGVIRTGDDVEILPSAGKRARVRGIQVYGQSLSQAFAGERTAINLQGVEVEDLHRGQVLVPASTFQSASMLDVRLRLLPSAPRQLRTRSRVRLHIGTAEVLARVVLLGQSELAPGETGYAQLRLESPLVALPQDRFIIRSASPAVTIGGGRVIDSLPEKHRASAGQRILGKLTELDTPDDARRIALLVEMSGEHGMTESQLVMRTGIAVGVVSRAAGQLVAKREVVLVPGPPPRVIARSAFEGLAARMKEQVKAHHRRHPLSGGMSREELRERIFTQLDPEVFRAVITAAASRGEIIADKDLVRLKGFRVALTPEEEAFKDHLASVFAQAALQPASRDDALSKAAPQFGLEKARARSFAQMLLNSGELIQIEDLVFHRDTLAQLRATLQEFKKRHGAQIDVGGFKDLTSVSRKYAIPLLEYLDRQRITRRVGNAREII